MDYVYFETAKLMQRAGFPQPKVFKTGMRAYAENGEIALFTGPEYNNEGYVFAPTATDIMKQLPKYCTLMRIMTSDGEHWACRSNTKEPIYYINPAEACAAAWLAIHEKPATK